MKENHINIFALGGLDENGKNCYVLEYNESIYIINTGTKIPINSKNGVDTLIPSFEYLQKNAEKIKGVFISDVKNESFSALPWLLMKVPNLKIYTSSFNKIMILDRLSKYKIDNPSYKVEVLNKTLNLGEIFVQPIALAGSMPGHIGFDFITPNGDILFLFNFVEGDLGIYGRLNFEELAKKFTKRKILCLVVDAGKANYGDRAINKINLPQNIKDIFLSAKEDERIIIGAYDEEMVAIQQILELAIETNRPVITYGKTYGQILNLIQKSNPTLKWPKIIDYKYANKTKNAVILVTGSTERLYSRFLRITDNKDVFLKLIPSDTVIMLAPAVNGLESLEALTLDEIAKITPKISDVSNNEFYRHHPTKVDLVNLVKAIEPKYIIPVEGLYRYLADAQRYISEETNINKNNILLIQNGKVVHFVNDELLSTKGKVKEVGDTIIDGFGVGDISNEVINEREMLGRDGVVLISCLYNPKNKLLTGKMQINFVGVIDKEEKKEAQDLIKSTILKLIESETFDGLKDFQNRARHMIRKKMFKSFDKEPMVIVSLNQI